MRHNKDAIKLGRTSSHRKALWRNMATSLFREGRIRTTEAKAKELRRVADRLVTLAKRAAQFSDPDEQRVAAHRLHLRRQALGFIRDKAVVAKLFDEIADRYLERSGGYTRVIRLGLRKGDGAQLALIELVEEEITEKEKKKHSRKGGKSAKAAKKTKSAASAKAKKKAAAAEEVSVEDNKASSDEESVEQPAGGAAPDTPEEGAESETAGEESVPEADETEASSESKPDQEKASDEDKENE